MLRRSTQSPRRSQSHTSSLEVLRVLRYTFVALWSIAHASAHDLEKTRVQIAFARDGTFVVDVANDPDWLKLRLESFPGPFADRIVLWVDGREIRPDAVEFIPPDARSDTRQALAIHRLRGRMPADARTLRWYYGLVGDPYPLTIRRADGRVIVEEVQGDAWSRTVDLSGQFHAPLVSGRVTVWVIAALLLLPLGLRVLTTTDTKDTNPQHKDFLGF